MNEKVLDASVLLALLLGEPLPDWTLDLLGDSVMSTVSVAEVFAKLAQLGPSSFPRCDALLAMLKRIDPFTTSQARISGDLRISTAHAGLSLGDRACLALAVELGAEVYTCDRPWSRVEIGLTIHILR